MIKAIVAAGKNWEIGKANGLLFKLPKDMQFFRDTTKNSIVVCGENTLLSFPNGKSLKNRTTIVLAQEGHEYGDCITYHSFENLIHDLQLLSITNTIFIVGGGMMYKSMLPYCDEIIVNKVDAEDLEATVFFPNLDNATNYKIKSIDKVIEDNGYQTRMFIYEKV